MSWLPPVAVLAASPTKPTSSARRCKDQSLVIDHRNDSNHAFSPNLISRQGCVSSRGPQDALLMMFNGRTAPHYYFRNGSRALALKPRSSIAAVAAAAKPLRWQARRVLHGA